MKKGLYMIKKIITLLLMISMTSTISVQASSYIDQQIKASKKSQKYNSVKKHAAVHNATFEDKNFDVLIKDPKLITFNADTIKSIDNNTFAKKLKSDEVYYNKQIIPELNKNTTKYRATIKVDFLNLYRVAENIIRANKLDYMNWRIVLFENTAEFNAMSGEANLICINTALYDSLYGNDDALAFVIGHEMAHQILGHSQRNSEMAKKTDITENVLIFTTLGYGNLIYSPIRDRVVAKESRLMEFDADVLGAEFAIRAGYSYEKFMEALNFMNALPHAETLKDSHPIAEKRIANLNATQKYFLPQWFKEGKYNIYNSKPLNCKRSSDRCSIVLYSNSSNNKDYYKQESPEELLKRIGYIDYRSGNTLSAIKYFTQWSELSNSYIPHLYLSYCYERMYKQTQKPKLLKKAIEEAKLANLIEQSNTYVKQQLNDLKDMVDL